MHLDPPDALPLPPRPDIEHYKKQAKELVKACQSGRVDAIREWAARWLEGLARAHRLEITPQVRAEIESRVLVFEEFACKKLLRSRLGHENCTLADAQFVIARVHGFETWAKFAKHLEGIPQSVKEIGDLKLAIDRNDLDAVAELMTLDPRLHRARLGYGNDGPLTLAAECGAPTESRLSIARWMIENGSDVHQGGDGPLMRAALSSHRIPMMELLVSHGANVNAEWHDSYPIIFAACEAVDPVSLKWLLDHGANPNCDRPGREHRGTALEYVIGSYVRSPELAACIDLLVEAGGVGKYDAVVLDALRGNLDRLAARLDADPALTHRRFPQLDFGTTGGRMLTLRGATLLHVAAEYVNPSLATLLLDRGGDVNVPALVDDAGVGGQTPIFHAVTQFKDAGLPMVRLLMDRGADVSIRAKVPGHYERPGEILECTPLGYAIHFRDETSPGDKAKTIALLMQRGTPE